MTLVLIAKGLVLEGWPSKIEVSWVLGLHGYQYYQLSWKFYPPKKRMAFWGLPAPGCFSQDSKHVFRSGRVFWWPAVFEYWFFRVNSCHFFRLNGMQLYFIQCHTKKWYIGKFPGFSCMTRLVNPSFCWINLFQLWGIKCIVWTPNNRRGRGRWSAMLG